jgi:FAD/FMN-containing dehydrogenase
MRNMFIDELKKNFKGDIADDEQSRVKFSHDASIFEVKPTLVIAPKDSADVQAAVKAVITARQNNEQLSLTARAAGTCMSGGSLTESVVVDMTKYFTKIEDVVLNADKQGGSAIVEPGVFFRDFEQEADRRNLMMPAYPASKGLCMVGGMVANNAGGEKTPAYGKIENYLLELRVVLADGNEYVIKPLSKAELDVKMLLPTFEGRLYKQLFELITANQEIISKAKPNVTKNSAGYYLWNVWDPEKGVFDLPRLIVGSQGTLGIITRVTFRLVPRKRLSKLLVVFLKKQHMKDLGNIIVDLKSHNPETIESYDDNTLKLAFRFFPELVRILKPKNILAMAWHLLPEAWIFITGGMPKLVVMAEFTGNDMKDIQKRAEVAQAGIAKFGAKSRITMSEEEEREFWVIRREAFSLLRNKVKDKHTAPFIDDFAVRAELLPEFLPKLNAILDQYKLIYTIMGHPGDGNFHIIPLMNLEDQSQRAIIPKLSDEVYNLVLEYKGTITAEHNDGLIRSPYLEKMYGPEIMQLFEKTKKIFDPENIFNPGKKVGSSLGYSMSHIRKSF